MRPWPGKRRLPTVIETSAGGLVLDRPARDAAAVLIARRDRRGQLEWVFPKGHLESGETVEVAAIREVTEETGLHGRILAPLGTIEYRFVTHDRLVHKVVHHFLFLLVGGLLSVGDPEVVEVAWFPLAEVAARLRYDSERALLDRLPDLMAGLA